MEELHKYMVKVTPQPKISSRQEEKELTDLLLSSNTKQFSNLLQSSYYYSGISALQYQSTLVNMIDNEDTVDETIYQSNKASPEIQSNSTLKDQLGEFQTKQQNIDSNQGLESNQQQYDQIHGMDRQVWMEQEKYLDQFRDSAQKKPRMGLNFQIEHIPLITDLTDFEFLQDLEAEKLLNCHKNWDPERISEFQLNNYLQNIENHWPHHIFHYQEEIALLYLQLKNYDVESALSSVLYNIDELVKLLLVIKKKRIQEGFFINVLKKQNNKNQVNNRVLRERKNREGDDTWESNEYM
eukprot:403344447